MTLQERRRRVAALSYRLRFNRRRLADALQAMDYELALARQVEIDHLQDEIGALQGQNSHVGLILREHGEYQAS